MRPEKLPAKGVWPSASLGPRPAPRDRWEVAISMSSKEARQAAWDRIQSLGGNGVWEPDMFAVSLSGTSVTDDDLRLFEVFSQVHILDLSDTSVGDEGLEHLARIPVLEKLIVVNTRISDGAIDRFRSEHPAVSVVTRAEPRRRTNPFTGKRFDSQ